MNLRKLYSILAPVDVVSIVFLFFLNLLNIIFFGRVQWWREIVLVNFAVTGGIVLLAWLAWSKRTKLLIGFHRWYCYLIVLFVFKEIYLMVHHIHPIDYDALLISIDHWMFGVNPTQWLAQFAHPVLTEILQVAYFSYYILFIIVGVEIYRRHPVEEFDKAAFLIVYGFYISYLGYFLLPAVGPRFTLHDFASLNTDLPGVFFTDALRQIINTGESIPPNHPNPIEFVQRDVFPSGHTQLSLIVVILGFRYNVKTKWLLASLAALLIVGTVYLRYHYVIDLFAGALFTWLTIWTGDSIERWWSNHAKLYRAMLGLESHVKIP